MRYVDARPHLTSGSLVFFRGAGFFSWLIRAWTASDWAHVGMLWVVGGRVMLLESTASTGVRLLPLSRKFYEGKTGREVVVALTPQPLNDHELQVALSKLGIPYSVADAVEAGMGLPLTGNGIECAEYVADILDTRPAFRNILPVPANLFARVSVLGWKPLVLKERD